MITHAYKKSNKKDYICLMKINNNLA